MGKLIKKLKKIAKNTLWIHVSSFLFSQIMIYTRLNVFFAISYEPLDN